MKKIEYKTRVAVKNPSEKLAAHNDALYPLMEELRQVFIKVVNQSADMAEFIKAVEHLNEFRRFINSAENIGFIVGPDNWRFAVFPLTGDPQKDIGQIALDLPKKQMN